ncbi:MAG: PTS sugar transporter subunit IIA [Planctomycetota bacterium]
MNRELIQRVHIRAELEATDKPTTLRELLGVLIDGGGVDAKDRDSILESLEERERKGSTGIGNGFAVPHVKADVTERPEIVLARSVDGLDYAAVDGRPVHVFFLIVSPVAQADQHLEVLRWVSTLARNADFRRFALAASDADSLRDLLVEMLGEGSAP